MSSGRALRGSCHCGRNQYVITIPHGTSDVAQMVFDSAESHRMSSATLLSEFLRVPIHWYHSRIFPFFSDESRATIRRVYSHPDEQSAIRQFCGFCGTTLTYWTEHPVTEAGYIQVTLGSLLTEDLYDLDALGLVPDEPEQDPMDIEPTLEEPTLETDQATQPIGHDSTGIPWFENLTLGSRLGSIYSARRVEESRDGRFRVEYEITEWAEGDDTGVITGLFMEEERDTAEAESEEDGEEAMHKPEPESPATGKRKRRETEEGDEKVGNTA